MSVLCEALSVVVRQDVVARAYGGSVGQFRADCPNTTLCEDGYLLRVGFMRPDDVGLWVRWLQRNGLVFVQDGRCVDIAVVDQHHGPTAPCDWLEFRQGEGGPPRCWRRGSPEGELATPTGWIWKPETFTYVPNEEVPQRLVYLGNRHAVDVYHDTATGKEQHIGGPTS